MRSRDPAADRGAERSADALHRHHRALADIDPAGAVQDARDETGHGDALQAGADAVEHLHRDTRPIRSMQPAATRPRIGSARNEISSTSQ